MFVRMTISAGNVKFSLDSRGRDIWPTFALIEHSIFQADISLIACNQEMLRSEYECETLLFLQSEIWTFLLQSILRENIPISHQGCY